jgi:hypothetical protein
MPWNITSYYFFLYRQTSPRTEILFCNLDIKRFQANRTYLSWIFILFWYLIPYRIVFFVECNSVAVIMKILRLVSKRIKLHQPKARFQSLFIMQYVKSNALNRLKIDLVFHLSTYNCCYLLQNPRLFIAPIPMVNHHHLQKFIKRLVNIWV